MMTDIDAAKSQVEQVLLENEEMINELINAQTMDTISEKNVQVNLKLKTFCLGSRN